MASNRMIAREKKRQKQVQLKQQRRDELRAQLKDPSLSLEEKFEVHRKMKKLGRDSNKIRLSNRCRYTGRAHGVIGKFGMSRIMIRNNTMLGHMPGMVMASW